MINEHQLVSIFCEIDDFCKELDKNMSQLQLTGPIKGKRGPGRTLRALRCGTPCDPFLNDNRTIVTDRLYFN